MSCCGNKRAAAVAAIRSGSESSATRHASVTAMNTTRGTQFEYNGGHSITVVGQGTGYQYRFVGFGARLSVDPRDYASLAIVPQLREV